MENWHLNTLTLTLLQFANRTLIRNRKGNLNANCLEVIKTVACTFCWPWLGQEERHCIILCVRLERCRSWSACCLGDGEAMQMGCVCPCRCSSVAVTNVDCSTFRLHKFNWPDLTWQRTRVQCFGYSNVCIIKTNSPTAPHNNATFSFDSSTKSQPVPGLILTPIVLPHILLPDTFALGCKGFDSPSSFFVSCFVFGMQTGSYTRSSAQFCSHFPLPRSALTNFLSRRLAASLRRRQAVSLSQANEDRLCVKILSNDLFTNSAFLHSPLTTLLSLLSVPLPLPAVIQHWQLLHFPRIYQPVSVSVSANAPCPCPPHQLWTHISMFVTRFFPLPFFFFFYIFFLLFLSFIFIFPGWLSVSCLRFAS